MLHISLSAEHLIRLGGQQNNSEFTLALLLVHTDPRFSWGWFSIRFGLIGTVAKSKDLLSKVDTDHFIITSTERYIRNIDE